MISRKELAQTESTLVSIEMIDGEKYIHYSGYGYSVGEEFISGKPARWIDYTWLMCPLKEALEYGIGVWESDNQEFVQQYIEDLTYNELDECYANPKYGIIRESEITMDTPCGTYFIINDKEN